MPKRLLPWLAAALGGGVGAVVATALGAPVALMGLAQLALAITAYQLTKMRLGLNP